MTTKLGENSWISVGLTLILLSAAFWAALAYAQVAQSAKDITELKGQQASYAEELKQVHKQLDTIQGILMGGKARRGD